MKDYEFLCGDCFRMIRDPWLYPQLRSEETKAITSIANLMDSVNRNCRVCAGWWYTLSKQEISDRFSNGDECNISRTVGASPSDDELTYIQIDSEYFQLVPMSSKTIQLDKELC